MTCPNPKFQIHKSRTDTVQNRDSEGHVSDASGEQAVWPRTCSSVPTSNSESESSLLPIAVDALHGDGSSISRRGGGVRVFEESGCALRLGARGDTLGSVTYRRRSLMARSTTDDTTITPPYCLLVRVYVSNADFPRRLGTLMGSHITSDC